jgi:hypothetical protein
MKRVPEALRESAMIKSGIPAEVTPEPIIVVQTSAVGSN